MMHYHPDIAIAASVHLLSRTQWVCAYSWPLISFILKDATKSLLEGTFEWLRCAYRWIDKIFNYFIR